jgi:hypothetical protein
VTADDFQSVARVAKRSRIAQTQRKAIDRLRIAGSRSFVAGALRNARARLSVLGPAERVRLLGVVILTAAVTHAVLVQWSPSIVRPQAPRLLWYEILAVSVVMIGLAGPIARAWSGSLLRRLFARRLIR